MREILINNNIKINQNSFYLSTSLIFIISALFALLVGSGFYGYGNDFYAAYYKSNLNWGGPFDRLGYAVSTLTIYQFHIGVYIVTFVLSLSTGYLIREHIKFKKSYSLILFIILYLIAIHTWPIIMSTSNAMRQGLTMSLVFLIFVFISRKNFFLMFIFSILGIFMHKSGLILFAIIFFANVINFMQINLLKKNKEILYFIIGFFLFVVSYYFVKTFYPLENNQPTKIINGDFRWAFILISSSYVVFSFFYLKILNNPYNLSLYFYSFVSPSLLFCGLNWEFERLGMMMLIPYIFAFGVLFNRLLYQYYLIITFIALLFLTIYTGMYASLK